MLIRIINDIRLEDPRNKNKESDKNMDRTEKIDSIVEFLDEDHIKIIDITSIGSIVIDAEQCLDKVDNNYEYGELLDKGLTDRDIESFKKFLEKNTLMMIRIDEISGVSFENSEYNIDELYGTDLWSNEGITKADKEQLIEKLETDIFELINKFEKELPDGTYVTDISINRKNGDVESVNIDTI